MYPIATFDTVDLPYKHGVLKLQALQACRVAGFMGAKKSEFTKTWMFLISENQGFNVWEFLGA